jgi:hypothetical protein
MVLELATILLGATVGAIAVLYAASRGYLGRAKKAATTSTPSITAIDSYAPTTEQAEVPAAEAPAVAEPAPSPTPEITAEPTPEPAPAPAIYETVQPAPAPVTFAPPPASSFSAPTFTKKPTRTYRRRAAPVRGAAGSRKTLAKPKKR